MILFGVENISGMFKSAPDLRAESDRTFVKVKRKPLFLNATVVPYLAITTRLGKGDIDGVFVDIKTDKNCAKIIHDLPPYE
jgi:hypothetical protein